MYIATRERVLWKVSGAERAYGGEIVKITNIPRTMEEWNSPHLIVFYGLVDLEQCERIVEDMYNCLKNGGNIIHLFGEPPSAILEIEFVNLLPGMSEMKRPTEAR